MFGFGIIATGGLLASAMSTSAGAQPVPATGPGHSIVKTTGGLLQGKTTGRMREFLGIPYAAAPVGRLRWRAPKPPASWTGARDATAFGPHCPQPSSPFGQASTSENCLFLNVFAPAHSRHRQLPVMVWLHGGTLLVGESDDFNPAGLVRHGVIVVTINYRLGALGFLADAALANRPGGPTGDYGLLDQQAALRWVQRNIGNFGGDRHDVTLFGESAGGLSVLSQLVSPGARGLFARAIVESGTYNLTQTPQATAESAGDALAAKVGCTTNVAVCLRGLSIQTIIDKENFGGYRPNLNSRVLPTSIGAALRAGEFNRVPVVIGTNHDEWRLFVALSQLSPGGVAVTADNYQSMIESTLGVPAAAAAQYPLSNYLSPPVALGAVGTDAIFACPALAAEESLSAYVPTYAFEFNDENAPERFLPPAGFPYGAAHDSETQYLFDLSNTPLPGVLSGPQRALAGVMKRDWTNFAKTGVPSRSWSEFTPGSPVALSLIPPRPQLETSFATDHQCAFWSSVEG
jgi:para-nitrobenzyl esterase